MLRLAASLRCLPSLAGRQSRIYVAQQKNVGSTSSASVPKYGGFPPPIGLKHGQSQEQKKTRVHK